MRFLAFAITENILSQLVAFNVGVELAQILFIVASSLLLHRLLLPRVGAVRLPRIYWLAVGHIAVTLGRASACQGSCLKGLRTPKTQNKGPSMYPTIGEPASLSCAALIGVRTVKNSSWRKQRQLSTLVRRAEVTG
jgi:hypothetical protein